MVFTPSLLKGFKFEEVDKELSKLGNEGWEVISMICFGDYQLVYTLKREI
ncbi:MAG: hypothetical protein Q4A00_04515 [Flavobacteriaceae bacterium]|nr:hypothetical protein [Flavobacteriaceae bacterium]